MASFKRFTQHPAFYLLAFLPLGSFAASSKRGLSYNTTNSPYIQKWNNGDSQVSWAYNWGSNLDDTFPNFMDYVPMLWGTNPDLTGSWFTNANAAISRGSKYLLSFNEPDNVGQANLQPQNAVNAYHQYMMPFAGKAELGAPAVTNGAEGLPWLKNFLSLCTGCRIDFIPIHWYDSATNEPYFRQYLQNVHAVAGSIPIWVTEFNGAGSIEQQTSFLQQVMPWMDSQSWIARYAWFICWPGSSMGTIVDWNGNPTQLGTIYATT